MTRFPHRFAFGLLVCSVLHGCPVTEGATPRAPASCTEIGARCATEDGPVGVCNDTGKTDCASPPCLACMPQH